LHYQEEAAKTIKLFVESEVITKVDYPTEWISPAFFVAKPDGIRVRLVTDFTGLNKFISRPVHPFLCPQDIIKGILPTSKYFITLDAVQGYYQVPLDAESSDLTTFLLPDGKYKFLRAPMGLKPSSDEWCQRSDIVFANIPGLLKIVDDILIQAPNKVVALTYLEKVLLAAQKHEITLSRAKIKRGSSVCFAGYIISDEGVKPHPDRVKSLSEFPRPTNLTELRGFLGLVNQLTIFVPDMAHLTDTLRLLLKKNVEYLWLKEHEDAFIKIKCVLTGDMVVRAFNPDLETQIITDASRLKGLGYALMQREGDQMFLVKCGSRSLLPAETRYATNELECLAIQWGILACKHYLLGCRFTVLTDHRPLIGTFNKNMAEIENARLLKYREKLSQFQFNIEWIPGKINLIADALSRAPVFSAAEDSTTTISVSAVSTSPDLALADIIEAAKSDDDYQAVIGLVLADKSPKKVDPVHPGRLYSNIWEDISLTADGLLVYLGTRIIVPRSFRQRILTLLHVAHAGIVRTRKLAQKFYYWPGINNDIKHMIDLCDACQEMRASNPQSPLLSIPRPTVAMQSISTDLAEKDGISYLITVCRYSGYPFVHKLKSTVTTTVIGRLESIFDDYGWPRRILSDGGPQFRTEFNTFCNQHFIEHILTSPYHAQSNGLAEAAVKNMKHLIIKIDNFPVFIKALIHWRNVPRANDDLSPAEMFFGRRLRTNLPTLEESDLSPSVPSSIDATLPPIKIGDKVRIQHPKTKRWDRKATVIGQRQSQRSFTVMDDETSRIYLRNRKFLRLRAIQSADSQISPQTIAKSSSEEVKAEVKILSPPIQGHKPVTRSETRRQREEEKKRDVHFGATRIHTY
jgi:hypothetical protein